MVRCDDSVVKKVRWTFLSSERGGTAGGSGPPAEINHEAMAQRFSDKLMVRCDDSVVKKVRWTFLSSERGGTAGGSGPPPRSITRQWRSGFRTSRYAGTYSAR